MAKIDEQQSGKRESEIRYLTPSILTLQPRKNTAALSAQGLSM